jgi:hypothetical protein
VVCVLVATSVGGWWWHRGANERHVRDLVTVVYRYSGGAGDSPNDGVYNVNHFYGPNTCGGIPESDSWIGELSTSAPVVGDDGLSRAELAARRFTTDGWNVRRYVAMAGGKLETRLVLAERGNDRLDIVFASNGLSLGVSSGPCNREFPPDQPPPNTSYVGVEEFND